MLLVDLWFLSLDEADALIGQPVLSQVICRHMRKLRVHGW